MRKHKGSEPSRPASEGYLLPEDAHLTLIQTSEHLHLLARLTAPRSPHDDLPEAELSLKPVALAHCFQELADRLDHTLRQVRWPEAPPAA
ncbi:XAC0095 family protein [Luteimonas salinilitoris]|uniref:XAC0095 family protein n=1 Tax=Luteimonas salinilitoris TaxID=3237697 RepID=A0ABV4HUI0_9GAMM